MTAKEYLAQTLNLDRKIDNKLDQIATLRALASKATATVSDMPKSGSPAIQSLENIVVKIIDLEHEVTADIDTLVDLKKEIMTIIKQLPSAEDQLLLEQRYLCSKRWSDIAAFLDVDVRYIHKRHNRAAAMLENFLPSEVKKTLNDTISVCSM